MRSRRVANFTLVILCIFFVFSNYSFAFLIELPQFYSQATGNNVHESKIQAYDYTFRKAFSFILDKYEIPKDLIDTNISYTDLKKIFPKIIPVTEILEGTSYKANFSVFYDVEKLYALLLLFGKKEIHNYFYNCFIIPVFEKGNNLYLSHSNKYLIPWTNYEQEFKKARIYLGNISDNIEHLKKEITTYTYEDFIKFFGNSLFKKVILVNYEFWTKEENSALYIKFKVKELSFYTSEPTYFVYNVDLKDSSENQILSIERFIEKMIIDRYSKSNDSSAMQKMVKKIFYQKIQNTEETDKSEFQKFDMLFLSYDDNELKSLKKKLSTIYPKSQYSIKFLKSDLEEKTQIYSVSFNIYESIFELSEHFYLTNLSYVEEKDGTKYIFHLRQGA